MHYLSWQKKRTHSLLARNEAGVDEALDQSCKAVKGSFELKASVTSHILRLIHPVLCSQSSAFILHWPLLNLVYPVCTVYPELIAYTAYPIYTVYTVYPVYSVTEQSCGYRREPRVSAFCLKHWLLGRWSLPSISGLLS